MKTLLIILLSAVGSTCFAQISNTDISPDDQPMVEKMEDDLITRSPNMQPEEIRWDADDKGYSANYAVEEVGYVNRYNRNGDLERVLRREEWTKAPVAVRDMVNNNPDFRGYEVVEYWGIQNNDYTPSGTYQLNLRDGNGQIRYVTITEGGEISDDTFGNKNLNNDDNNPAPNILTPLQQNDD